MLNNGEQWLTMGKDPKQKEPDSLLIIFDTSKYRSPKKENKTSFSLNRCFTLTNQIAQRFYAYSTLFLFVLLFSWYRAVSRTKHITCGICWVCMKEEVLWIVGAPPKSLMLLLLLLLWLDHAAPWMKYSMCRSYVGLGWEGGCVDSRPSQTSHTPWCTSLPKSAQSTRWAAFKHSLFQVFLIYFSLKCADHQTL